MQTDKRRLTDRAKLWNKGMKGQFASVELQPEVAQGVPQTLADGKWF